MSGWRHHMAVLVAWPLIFASGVLLVLWVVGETVEHFTP